MMFRWPWSLGPLDPGPVVSGYFGLILFSAAAVALGLLVSSFVESQAIAFFVTVIVLGVDAEGNESPVLEGTGPLTRNQQAHLVVSYNIAAGSVRLYLNGQRIAVGPATIPLNTIEDVNNWLGRSNWPDPNFNGTFNEFRIYDGPLLDADVAANFASGPDLLPGEAPPPQASLSISFSSGNLVITWPGAAAGFTLESTASLGAQAVWTPVSANVVTENGANKVTMPAPQGTSFFRLRK
jgi:hypothetical protein